VREEVVAASIVIVEAEGRQLAGIARGAGLNVVSAVALSELSSIDRGRPAPDVLVVDLRGASGFPPELGAFKRRHPRTGVVIVVPQLDPATMLDAMRAGVTEAVPDPVTASELRAAVDRIADQEHQDGGQGRTLAFIGAKGGVGSTTLAINVASVLAAAQRAKVLMVDLHITGHGDAALFLGVEPHFSVQDALENVHRLDGAFLRSLVVRAKSGVDVLASPSMPSIRQPDGQQLRSLLERLSVQYDYVVLDVPRSDLGVIDAIEPVSAVTLVLNQELPTVRRASQIAALLRQRYGKDRVGAVVSRYDARAEIGQEDIERVVGLPVWAVLPSDYRRAVAAANVGRPIVAEAGSRLAAAVQDLAGKLGGMKAEAVAAAAPTKLMRRVGGIF
jgi:pilus assembly protein CpaE